MSRPHAADFAIDIRIREKGPLGFVPSVFIFLFVLELHQTAEGSLEVSLQSALVLKQQPEVGCGGQGSEG